MLAGLHLGDAAHVLAHIVGQFHAFAPLLVDIHLALRQLHHNVSRLETGVVGQIRTHAERTFDFALAIVEYAQALFKVKRVAEYDGLAHRVNTEFTVCLLYTSPSPRDCS